MMTGVLHGSMFESVTVVIPELGGYDGERCGFHQQHAHSCSYRGRTVNALL